MSETTAADVARRLELAIDAARDHLAAVEQVHAGRGTEHDVNQLFRMVNALSAEYADALFDVYEEVTPWSEGVLDDGWEDEHPSDVEVLPEPTGVSVHASYHFIVDDPEGLVQVVRERALSAGTGDELELQPEHVGHAIYALFHARDGVFEALLDVPQLLPIQGEVEIVAWEPDDSGLDPLPAPDVEPVSGDGSGSGEVLFSFSETWADLSPRRAERD